MADLVTDQTAAAGWYPVEDPLGHERYWNGTAWEDATRPVQTVSAPPKRSRKTLIIVVAVVVVVIIMLCGVVVLGGILSATNSGSSGEPAVTSPNDSGLDNDDAVEVPAEEPVVEEPTEPAMTLGQEQAVDKGKAYLDYAAFSRKGLIEQLVYEGFSNADATFAVDTIAPDWNEQAAKKAQDYLDYSSFSRQGLIDQLVFEGFSQAQAEYGAKAVGY